MLIISGAPGYSWVRLKVHDVGRSVAPQAWHFGATLALALWRWHLGLGEGLRAAADTPGL